MPRRASLASLLALLLAAPLAEASLSRVSAAERAIEAPSLTLASAPELSKFSLFAGNELASAAAESERAPSFHPLATVSLLSKDGAEAPLVSVDELIYPKTRYRVFDFLGTTLVGVERGVSLELHWRSASFSCELSSGTVGWLSQDPMGDKDSPNLYGFVKMRPHELRDPMGTDVWDDLSTFYDSKVGRAIQAGGRGIVKGAVVGAAVAAAVATAPVTVPILIVGGGALAAIDVAGNYQSRRIEQIQAGTSTAPALALALGDTTGLPNVAEGILGTNLATGQGLSTSQATARLEQGSERVGMGVGAAAGAGTVGKIIGPPRALAPTTRAGEQPRNALGQFAPKTHPGQVTPGQSAVDDFVAQAQKNGFDVVGREVTVDTPFGMRRYDVALRNRQTGSVHGFEVKSSPAAFDRFDQLVRQQFAADRWLNGQGGVNAIGKHEGIQIQDATKLLWELQ